MSLKMFCAGCNHKNISPEVKMLFNKYFQPTFIQCPVPQDDGKVWGCFIKNMKIDWDEFQKWCVANDIIKEE